MNRLKQAWLALAVAFHLNDCAPVIASEGIRRCGICSRPLKVAKGKRSNG